MAIFRYSLSTAKLRKREMAAVGTPAVCVLLLLAAAGSVVSGFTPVTYPATISSECNQYDPLQDQQQLTEALSQAVDCILPNIRSCQKILYTAPHQLPQATTR